MFPAVHVWPVVGAVSGVGSLHARPGVPDKVLPDGLGALTPLQQPATLGQGDHLTHTAQWIIEINKGRK